MSECDNFGADGQASRFRSASSTGLWRNSGNPNALPLSLLPLCALCALLKLEAVAEEVCVRVLNNGAMAGGRSDDDSLVLEGISPAL